MAKKAAEGEAVSKEKTNDELVAQLRKEFTKEYGEEIFKSGQDIIDRKQHILSVSPAIDLALRGTSPIGGIPEGTVATISGKPKTGKSTSILSFCAECQKPENGNRHIYYIDVEYRLKKMNLAGIKGLDYSPERFTTIRSSKDKILHAEDYLNICDKICNTHPGSILVIDSASALCLEKESEAEMKAETRNGGPKLLAQFFRKISNVIPVNNVTVIAIQHMIANTSGMSGPSYIEDGGNKIQFALDTKMRLIYSEKWKVGSEANEKVIGLILHWEIVTSALGTPPGQKVDSYIRFGVGVDALKEWMELATNIGIITKAGSWLAFEENKLQGEEKLYQFFNENEEAKNSMISQVKGMLYNEST